MYLYKYKTQFLGNSYLYNYASGFKGILSVTALQIFDYKNEYFYRNGDSYSEILKNVGGTFNEINDFRYNSTIPQTMKAFIHFDFVICPYIYNLNVDGGFKYTLKYNRY